MSGDILTFPEDSTGSANEYIGLERSVNNQVIRTRKKAGDLKVIATGGTVETKLSDWVASVSGSTASAATVAALRALTTSTGPNNPNLVYVDGYEAAGDGGGGFFRYEASDTTSADNSATIFVDASNRRWYRQWDGRTFQAAWAGIFGGNVRDRGADVSGILKRIPQFCTVEYEPLIYEIAELVPQGDFSNRKHRGYGTLFNVTASAPDFSQYYTTFNWATANPPLTGIGYNNGYSPDEPLSGLSPIEGIGIVSNYSLNAGTGISFGGDAVLNQGQVRATTSKATGKWYFEFTVVANPLENYANAVFVGFATAGHALTTVLGGDALSFQWGNLGSYGNSTVFSYFFNSTAWYTGTTFGLCLDFDAQLAWGIDRTNPVGWNASPTANPATGVGGQTFSAIAAGPQYFPAICTSTTDTTIKFNFGGSSFAGAVPAGFTAWGASTTLNPADSINIPLIGGNLTANYTTENIGTNYPYNYQTRPRNFGVGGFYANVVFVSTNHCFLTGFENALIKAGSIGMYWDTGNDSGENVSFIRNYFGNLQTDGVEMFNAQQTNFINCSFDYNNRMFYLSNNASGFVTSYFETRTGSTPGYWGAVDGGATVNFDASTIILLLNTDGHFSGDLMQYGAGSGGYAQVYFDGTKMYEIPSGQNYRQFAQATAGQNIYGYFRGFNGNNYPNAVSPNQLMQADYNFASTNLKFYPTASGGVAAAGSIAFTVNPTAGQTIGISSGTVTFVASGATGNQVNIGANLAATLADLLTLLNASTDAAFIAFTYGVGGTTLNVTAKIVGVVGNMYTLATNVTGATATSLSGGTGLQGTTNTTNQASVVHAPQTRAAKMANAGLSSLLTQTWDVRAGDLIFLNFWNKSEGITSVLGSTVTFFTADGIAISSQDFTRAAGVSGFTPGGANLNSTWFSGGIYDWTLMLFVFRVPPGASKMNSLITTFNTTGFYISEFCVYNNSGA